MAETAGDMNRRAASVLCCLWCHLVGRSGRTHYVPPHHYRRRAACDDELEGEPPLGETARPASRRFAGKSGQRSADFLQRGRLRSTAKLEMASINPFVPGSLGRPSPVPTERRHYRPYQGAVLATKPQCHRIEIHPLARSGSALELCRRDPSRAGGHWADRHGIPGGRPFPPLSSQATPSLLLLAVLTTTSDQGDGTRPCRLMRPCQF
jgi:hypothetical protein